MKGALRGCVALMRRRSAGLADLDGAAAAQVLHSVASTALSHLLIF